MGMYIWVCNKKIVPLDAEIDFTYWVKRSRNYWTIILLLKCFAFSGFKLSKEKKCVVTDTKNYEKQG